MDLSAGKLGASQIGFNKKYISASPMVGSKSMKYSNCYFQMKGLRTLIQTVMEGCESKCAAEEGEALEIYKTAREIIKQLLETTYATFIPAAAQALDKLNDLLHSTTNKEVSVFLEKLLSAALACRVFASQLSTDTSKDDPQKMIRSNTPKNLNLLTEDSVICRICSESVPVDLIEEHTRMCIMAFNSDAKLRETNQKVQELSTNITDYYLNLPWPGREYEAVIQLIPTLHVVILLERVLEISPNESDALGELEAIARQAELIPNQFAAGLKLLSVEKRRLCAAIRIAKEVLPRTSIGGNKAKQNIQPPISAFKFLKRISSGAYARVFLAQHKKTGDIYAIKVVSREMMNQKNQVQRLLTEKDILLSNISPHIVSFYYSILGENNLYLVMEYLPGGDLYSLLQKVGCLDEESARTYTLEMASALAFLHGKGIIHRDMKPDNILVSKDGRLKLTDFGLSHMGAVGRQLASTEDVEQSKSLVGTPDYVAPEIVLCRPHSFAVDYWSLGAIVYELLCGIPPFHADTELETHAHIIRGTYEPLEDVSDEAADFVAKLLTLNPKDRLGSANEEDVLNHPWLKGLTLDSREPPFVPELRSQFDTEYFEERNPPTDEKDNSDIRADIEASEEHRVNGEDIPAFNAVSVEQLGTANAQAALLKRRERAYSEHPQGAVQPFLPTPPTGLAAPGTSVPPMVVRPTVFAGRRQARFNIPKSFVRAADDFMIGKQPPSMRKPDGQ